MDFENSRIEQARTEHEILLEDAKSAKKKKRSDRKRRRKIKFSDKHHSGAGMIATAMAICGIGLVASSIILSVARKGQAGWLSGYLPFFALIISAAGIIIAGISFKKTDTIYTFSWTGLILNIIVWLSVGFLLVSGL